MSSGLPTLTDHRFLRLFTVTVLYLSQGIGMGVIVVALPPYMAAQGLELAVIGPFMATIMAPWVLKFFFAPFMDRFTLLSLGRRRPWVLLGTVITAAGYLLMALVDTPFENLSLLLFAGMVSTTGTAIMDVAVDGMVIDIAPPEEHAQANGLMWGGKVVGTGLFATAAGWLYANQGTTATCLVALIATLIFGMLPLLLRERAGEKLLPWTAGKASERNKQLQPSNWRSVVEKLWKVMRLPASVVIMALILLVGLTQGIFDALLPTISVQELGWDSDKFTTLSSISQLITGLIGMALGGYLVNRWGAKAALATFLLFLLISSVAMAAAPELWSNPALISSYLFTHHLFRTLALITCFSIGMNLCWKQVATSQFAFYLAFGNFGTIGGSFLLGLLSKQLQYPAIILILGVIAALAAFLTRYLDIATHRTRIKELGD